MITTMLIADNQFPTKNDLVFGIEVSADLVMIVMR